MSLHIAFFPELLMTATNISPASLRFDIKNITNIHNRFLVQPYSWNLLQGMEQKQ